MNPQLPVYLAFSSLLAALPAQQLDQAKAIREITDLATTRVPSSQWGERNARIAKWLQAVNKAQLDLGAYSFTKAVAAYFGRDYDAAGQQMLAYLESHRKLPTDKFDTIAGRLLMNYARRTVDAGKLDLTRKIVPHATRLYSDPAMVYRAVSYSLRTEPDGDKTRLLNELLAQMLTDKRMSEQAKQSTLAQIYGGRRGGAVRGNRAGRARPAGAARRAARPARPTTIKPFVAKTIDGKELSLKKLHGKIVLVDFWATWCGPCIREMPNVVAAKKKFQDQGFVVVGVSLDQEPGQTRGGEIVEPDPDGATTKKIRATMKRLGMDWPCIYEGGGWATRLAKANGIRSIPQTFLIDRKGKVRYANLRGPALARRIQELIDEERRRVKRQ